MENAEPVKNANMRQFIENNEYMEDFHSKLIGYQRNWLPIFFKEFNRKNNKDQSQLLL